MKKPEPDVYLLPALLLVLLVMVLVYLFGRDLVIFFLDSDLGRVVTHHLSGRSIVPHP
jgi:hypothetical protein